jgi:undecaprenyl-diphosphatase
MATSTRIAHPGRKQLAGLALAIIALYIVVPQLGSFRHSLSLLPRADWRDLAFAAILTALSYVAAAGTYYYLALRPLRYGRTLLIQVAGMFVNRLLPAGIGGMGINYLYLIKSRHSGAQAASVVAANNILGVIGNSLLIGLSLAHFHDQLPGSLRIWSVTDGRFIVLMTLAVTAIWFVLYKYFGQRFLRAMHDFLKQFLSYRKRFGQVLPALACSLTLTVCNVASLWFCAMAMHIDLTFVPILLVFSFGVALGSATPTPGGLGGVEAGMVGGLILYGAGHSPALAAVLVYRLISYWLPLFIGAASFAFSERRHYI